MSSTVEFIRNFNSDNIGSIVSRFFDEIMVLYNLVGDIQDLDICTNNESSTAIFTLMMDSEDEAKCLFNRLNGYDFEVYGIRYIITMDLSGGSILTTITKATP